MEFLPPNFYHSMLMALHLFDFFLWSMVHGLATCSYTILQSLNYKPRFCSLFFRDASWGESTLSNNMGDYIPFCQLLTVIINKQYVVSCCIQDTKKNGHQLIMG